MISFVIEHKASIFMILFLASELIGMNSKIAESSVFQLIFNLLKKAVGK